MPLVALTNLESLSLSGMYHPTPGQAVREMNKLTGLDFIYENPLAGDCVEAILSTTGLRSLRLCYLGFHLESRFSQYFFEHLSGLTKLSLEDVAAGRSLFSLTGLIELCLRRTKVQSEDLSDALMNMPRLENLHLSFATEDGLEIKSSSLAQLQSLRQINLVGMLVEGSFITTLASLSGLKCLWFFDNRYQQHTLHFLTQLSLLSSLRCLAFLTENPRALEISPCAYLPDGSLPRLRRLVLNSRSNKTDGERQDLFTRLHSLRHFRTLAP